MSPRRLLPLSLLLLAGCPAHEGPIDVVLVDMDETAVVTWADAGSDDFVPCDNGTTDPDASAGCGPYGAGEPGNYVVRVEWGGDVVDKSVTLEDDGSYEANVVLTFDASEFEVVDEGGDAG